MGRRTLVAVAVAVTLAVSTVAQAGSHTVIEPEADAGWVGTIGYPSGQNFRSPETGQVVRVTLWSISTPSGGPGEVSVHAGERPGEVIGHQAFTWDTSPITIEFDAPPSVRAGRSYTVTATGANLQLLFGFDDPYPEGQVTLRTNAGWETWNEWNCGTAGYCLPFEVDQRVSIEIVGGDEDGDGVADEVDRCAGTVLPDPSVGLLRPNRFAATADGFVDRDGTVVASLADTGGCSALQIADALGLGLGVQWFGLTRPHLDEWVASSA